MFIPRRIVRDYMFASQVLMKTNDLNADEIEAVQEILVQLSKKFDAKARAQS